MTTSKIGEQKLCSLLFKTTSNYNANLQTLLTLLKKTEKNSIVVAPEVCLTGFDYDNFKAAVHFLKLLLRRLKKHPLEKL